MSDTQSQPNPYQPLGADPLPDASVPHSPSRVVLPLLALFATLYFVQGIVEPTAGLPVQPMQNRLEDWGRTPTQVGDFLFVIGLPWSFKLLFGLISDFLPIRGYRRFPYLVLSTAAGGVAFIWMSGLWSDPANERPLTWLLFATCVAIAMADVVIDGLAVETGQPLGLTGQMQSVQWGALSVAQMLGGVLTGFVSQHGLLKPAFLGCGLLSFMSLVVVLIVVREPRHARQPSDNLRQAWQQLKSGRKLVILVSVGLYLFLWNFNPFSSNVLQHYSTEVLGLSEQFYGNLSSIQGFTQVVACFAYFFVCRRIPFHWLVHASIACGILATLCYWPMHDARSAVVASLVFGLTYQTATLIQLDLAARVCPLASAATIFALLMAISNTGMTASFGVGGRWYDALTEQFGSRHIAFDALVAIGALFTAGCWLLVPVMRWAGVQDHR
jgi:MFS family permease